MTGKTSSCNFQYQAKPDLHILVVIVTDNEIVSPKNMHEIIQDPKKQSTQTIPFMDMLKEIFLFS